MAASTLESLARGVLLRCPTASYLLARQWVDFAFRKLVEKRMWSWLVKEGQFLFPAQYATGTVDVTFNSTTVTGTGTTFTAQMVGRQFRAGANNPIYTIATFNSATSIELDKAWGGATATGQGYQIWVEYQTVPSDFHSFISVIDPQQAMQLRLNVGQDELDAADPQRTSAGQPWLTSFRDYTTTASPSPPLPRYEIWPSVQQQYVLSYLYEKRTDDLTDSGATLPRYIPGNVLLESAMAECARWPGPSPERKNPYFNLGVADRHDRAFEMQVAELMRQDEEVDMLNVRYQSMLSLPFIAPGDAWWQSHAPAW